MGIELLFFRLGTKLKDKFFAMKYEHLHSRRLVSEAKFPLILCNRLGDILYMNIEAKPYIISNTAVHFKLGRQKEVIARNLKEITHPSSLEKLNSLLRLEEDQVTIELLNSDTIKLKGSNGNMIRSNKNKDLIITFHESY